MTHEIPRRTPVGLRLLAAAVLAVGLVAVAVLVLDPSNARPTAYVHRFSLFLLGHGVPGWAAGEGLWEFLSNIALFVPVGLLGAVLRPAWRLRTWLLVGLVVSGSVELFQGLVLPARDASPRDVLANTTGMVVGAALTALVLRLVRTPRPGRPARDQRT